MFIRLNKRGQSTLEYGIIIAVVVAALVAMEVYFKRGLQGKIRSASDDIGEQFSPGYTNANNTTVTTVTSTETIDGGENPTTTVARQQNQSRNSTENVATAGNEYWVQ